MTAIDFDAEDWRPFEFDDATAKAWCERGYEPFEAALSRDDGCTLSNYNVHHDQRTAARVRRQWTMAGFELVEARRWRQWMFTADEAGKWRRAGFDLEGASALRAGRPDGDIRAPGPLGRDDDKKR